MKLRQLNVLNVTPVSLLRSATDDENGTTTVNTVTTVDGGRRRKNLPPLQGRRISLPNKTYLRDPQCRNRHQKTDPRQERRAPSISRQSLPRSHRFRRLNRFDEILLRIDLRQHLRHPRRNHSFSLPHCYRISHRQSKP